MATAEDVLQGVNFGRRFDFVPQEAELDPALGFVVMKGGTGKAGEPLTQLLGFGVPGWQHGTGNLPSSTRSTTDILETPEELRTIDRQGKGVGARMYNTPQALGGTAENPTEIGAYTFAIDPRKVYDARRRFDRTPQGKARRVMRHLLLRNLNDRGGILAAVRYVHEEQGDGDVALYNQTPDGERRQRLRKQPSSVIPEEFMVIRNPGITLLKAGEFHRSEI